MSKLNPIRKIAVALILIWFSRPMVFRLINVDFSSPEYAQNYSLIWLIILPVSILIASTNSWNLKTKSLTNYLKMLGVLLGSIVLGILTVVSSFLCVWDHSIKIYQHKNENRKIVLRRLECGATDGSRNSDLVEIEPLTGYFYKYYYVDKSKLDMTQWK